IERGGDVREHASLRWNLELEPDLVEHHQQGAGILGAVGRRIYSFAATPFAVDFDNSSQYLKPGNADSSTDFAPKNHQNGLPCKTSFGNGPIGLRNRATR